MTKLEGSTIDGVGMVEFKWLAGNPYEDGMSAKVCFFAGRDTGGVLEIGGLSQDPEILEAFNELSRVVEAMVVRRFGTLRVDDGEPASAPQAAIPPGLVV